MYVPLLARTHRDTEGLIFYRCGFFLSSFFFRCLNSEVTERISTELGHILTYDSYLKNLVRTPQSIYLPHGQGAKKPLLGTDFDQRKTAKPMEMPFGMMSGLCPRNSVLCYVGVTIPEGEGAILRENICIKPNTP